MSERFSVTLPDGLAGLVEGVARESGTTEEVPTLSKSRVVRLLTADAAGRLVEGDLDVHDALVGPGEEVDEDDLAALVPDHVRAKFLYEETKAEAWTTDMKGGFEERVRNRLAERFKNGYDPEIAEELAEYYLRELRIFCLKVDDDRETYERKKEWLMDRLEDYRKKHETTTWDPDEDFLGSFEGVEDGRTKQELVRVAPQIKAIAEDRLRERHDRDRDAIIDAIDRHYDVPRETIAEIVDEVRRQNIVEDNTDDADDLAELPEDATLRMGDETDDDPEPVEVAKPGGTTIQVEGQDD